jgi:O-acetyl-ADP-ribose deacetylase (regulator of RNase III)
MLTFLRTSLLKSQAQTVVNTVNTDGVMGKGLASHFKTRYPDMYRAYQDICKRKQLNIGQLWLWKAPDQWVLNFPTKQHWRNPSRIEYIKSGLDKFVRTFEQKQLTEVAFPRLGCGNGGLDWNDVRPIMEKYLSSLPIEIYIHDFDERIGAPEHILVEEGRLESRSLKSFLADLRSLILKNGGRFRTINSERDFVVTLTPENQLLIERPGKRTLISADELLEAWHMLLRGPLTKTRLLGRAHDESSYVLGVLASLPYVRPLLLRDANSESGTLGIELISKNAPMEELRNQ